LRAPVLKADAVYQSGEIHEIAVWVYDQRDGELHNVAALKYEELRIFSDGTLNGCIATADWDQRRHQGETRWDRHRRTIRLSR